MSLAGQLHNSRDFDMLLGENWALSSLLLDSRRFKGQADYLLAHHFCELKKRDKLLQSEVQDLKQKLQDADGDIKLLRDQNARYRMDASDETVANKIFSPYERKHLVEQLESLKVKYVLLEKDLQTILDEKEELVTERDAYRNKVERLNHELNIALKGDEKRIIDIDSILMENRYLQERLKQTQEEKSLYLQTLSKYKNILEKRRNKSALKLGGTGSGSVIITHKQVEQMLQNTSLSQLPATQATVADLRSLALALFESLNDKNIALTHQKKANKILGHRLAELEKKISSLEISECWDMNDAIVDDSPGNVALRNNGNSSNEHRPSARNEMNNSGHNLLFNDFPKVFVIDHGTHNVTREVEDEHKWSHIDINHHDDNVNDGAGEENVNLAPSSINEVKKELPRSLHNMRDLALPVVSVALPTGVMLPIAERDVMTPELQKLIDDAMDDLNRFSAAPPLKEHQDKPF